MSDHPDIRRNRWTQVGLLLLALCAYLPGLQHSAAYQGDEQFYLYSALRMQESGEYLAPRYEFDAPRFQKPPLYYWLTAAAFRLGGPGFASGRAVSVLCSALSLVVVFRLGLLLFGAFRPALLSALLLAASPLFFLFARAAVTDAAMSLFILCSVYFFARGYRRQGARGEYALCWAAAAAATLCKGPVALLIIAVTVSGVAFANRRHPGNRRCLLPLAHPANLLLFAALTLPWYAWMHARFGAGFWRHLLEREAGDRIMRLSALPGDLAYYLLSCLRYSLPWSLLLLPFLDRRALRPWAGRTLLLSFLLLPLCFYALFVHPPSFRYLLPLCAPFALVAGRVFCEYEQLSPRRRAALLTMLGASGLVMLLPALCALPFSRLLPDAAGAYLGFAFPLFVAALAVLFFTLSARPLPALGALAGALLLALCLYSAVLLPTLSPQPLQAIGAALRADARPWLALDLHERPRVFLAVHAGRTPALTYTPAMFDEQPDWERGLTPPAGVPCLVVTAAATWDQFAPRQRARFNRLSSACGYDLSGKGRRLWSALRGNRLADFLAANRVEYLLLAYTAPAMSKKGK